MLRIARALGFLAPIAVAIFITVVLSTSPTATGAARDLQLLLAALALVAGMTSMALACWSYVGWRLNRIARALEDTLDADLPVQLRESGIPAERRLARAFNAAAGAFLQVEARATHDRLTGVANRETLLTTLVAEVERAARHHSWLSVAFIDIDRFKPINDTYGHNSGDAVLRQVASLIADNIRASDLFGRYGGEEFMLILPETQQDEAVVLAEKLRNLVAQHRLVIAGNQHVQATISIGVAGDIGSQLQVDALVDQADAAMYAAKSLGRNRTYLFRAVDETAPVRRAPISADHRAAATAIGRWASDTATEALASVLAPQPHHRGRPSDMIASLATGIALEMGLPREEIERIRVASLLHDLGKLAVPPEILDKPHRPVRRRVAGHRRAPAHRPGHPGAGLQPARGDPGGAPPPRALQRRRLSAWPARQRDPDGCPHRGRGRRLPRHGPRPAVQDGAGPRAGADASCAQNAGTQFDPEVVDVFCAVYADGVPPDGLEEVYRLHERARGGLERIDPHAAAAALAGEARSAAGRAVSARRPRSRSTNTPSAREATG